ALDVATKSLAFSRLSAGETTTLIPGLLHLQLATNRGIAFGLFPSGAWLWTSAAAVPLIAWVFLRSKTAPWPETACGALLLAGAIGNAWDRATLGYVRDFILVPPIPNFNLADALLNGGIAGLLLRGFLHDRRPVRDPGSAQAGQPDDGGLRDVGRAHGPRP
ncbi:MAG: signal peptidase II, partial [Planctomycetota bacterium]